jgi:hypothetical protein
LGTGVCVAAEQLWKASDNGSIWIPGNWSYFLSLEGVLKIPVAVCEVPYAKMSLADSTGIWVIGPPREGSLHRAKMLISGIFKHALSPWQSMVES